MGEGRGLTKDDPRVIDLGVRPRNRNSLPLVSVQDSRRRTLSGILRLSPLYFASFP